MQPNKHLETIRLALEFKQAYIAYMPNNLTQQESDIMITEILAAKQWLAALDREQGAGEVWQPIAEYKTGHKYGGMYIGNGIVTLWEEECEITKNLPADLAFCRLSPRPTPSLEAVLREVTEWQHKQFPHRSAHSIATHLLEEATELHRTPTDSEEIADVLLLLAGLANFVGVNLAEVAAAKLAKNKARVWGKPDGDGVVKHVEERPAPAVEVPDSPGWWAFEGHFVDTQKDFRAVWEVIELNGFLRIRDYPYQEPIVPDVFVGKWTELTMPWDAPGASEAEK